MAIRIDRATNITPESWFNMKNKLDLWKAEQKDPKFIPFPVYENIESNELIEG